MFMWQHSTLCKTPSSILVLGNTPQKMHDPSVHWPRSKMEVSCSQFSFDTVLGPAASQADLYHAAVAPIVDDVLNGYNGTIMAYGCTGQIQADQLYGTNGYHTLRSPFNKKRRGPRAPSCTGEYRFWGLRDA